jgi:spore germination protein YaaH
MLGTNVNGTMILNPSHRFVRWYVVFLLLGFLLLPAAAQADEVAVWIPWWEDEAGAQSALENIDEIDVLYPFVYEVDMLGFLVNRTDFSDDHWEELFEAAEDERVDIIPTVMWFEGDEIHDVLSDRRKRDRHIDEIVKMVRQHGFDGVNIDYEEKNAETIDYFSRFLRDLEDELGRKDLTCTVEARMRPEHRWRTVPTTIQYANDYEAMNRYCDWVEIMAYDQQRADILLNDQRRGVPYAPVADTEWVEHVLEFALEDFDEDKVMLGVATYGRAWDVTVAPEWYRDYERVATLNEPRIMELVEKYDVEIGRTEAGEAVITYFPEDSPWRVFDALPAPAGTPKGFEAAAKALLVATYADIEIPVRFLTWSDTKAVEEKLELVDEYDLRGTAIFKIDGEEPEGLWELF